MSWRTVVISSRCKLDTKMGYLVVRGAETRRIFLAEIAILLIENPAVALTGCLLEALVERKVRVIFCDARRSPMAELAPHHGSHDSSRKLRLQLAWDDSVKGSVWSAIVAEKIAQQAALLTERDKEAEALLRIPSMRRLTTVTVSCFLLLTERSLPAAICPNSACITPMCSIISI